MRAKIFHSSSDLTLTFNHNLPESSFNKGWGIRDLKLSFKHNTTIDAESMCGYAPSYPVSTKQCNCPDNYHLTTLCQPCNSHCENCEGLTVFDCYSCGYGFIMMDNECIPDCTNYLYRNNHSCIAGSSCAEPFISEGIGGVKTCRFPCELSQYYY